MQLSAEQQKAIDEQKQFCPFCKMARGEIQTNRVFENDDFLAVLDINPGVPGHTILLPKEHYPILPLMPANKQQAMALLLGDLCQALRKGMIVPEVDTFIANGAVAGQQSSHFIVHLLPSDNPLFIVPEGEGELQKKLEQLFVRKATPSREQLTKVISENPELRRMIIEQPEELVKNLHSAPDLAQLFSGVDIMKLSQRLREQEPTATRMSDQELIAFVNSKEKLRELLINDPATLQEAIASQPKLTAFFAGTTIAAVRDRYLRGDSHV